jgi:hypothetical protein
MADSDKHSDKPVPKKAVTNEPVGVTSSKVAVKPAAKKVFSHLAHAT